MGHLSGGEMPPSTAAAFQILLALADGDKHGYAIMQEVTQRTNGMVRLGPGTLYRTIKQMLDAGWIEECEAHSELEPANERRRYYRITEIGCHVAAAEAEQLETVVRAAYAKRLLSVREETV